ncbi:hypothetical protein ACWJJH_08840 [Endozoicomonadaceae bacterium StTr2]
MGSLTNALGDESYNSFQEVTLSSLVQVYIQGHRILKSDKAKELKLIVYHLVQIPRSKQLRGYWGVTPEHHQQAISALQNHLAEEGKSPHQTVGVVCIPATEDVMVINSNKTKHPYLYVMLANNQIDDVTCCALDISVNDLINLVFNHFSSSTQLYIRSAIYSPKREQMD